MLKSLKLLTICESFNEQNFLTTQPNFFLKTNFMNSVIFFLQD